MTLQVNTPTGTPFSFHVEQHEIVITSLSGGTHSYQRRAINDLYNWLKDAHGGNWVLLGSRNEQNLPNTGTVEDWARSQDNPAGGFYGLTPSLRGRFASYIPSVMELLGLVEIEHNAKNNRVRAI